MKYPQQDSHSYELSRVNNCKYGISEKKENQSSIAIRNYSQKIDYDVFFFYFGQRYRRVAASKMSRRLSVTESFAIQSYYSNW